MASIGEYRKREVESDWQRFMNLLKRGPKIKAEAHPHYGRWAKEAESPERPRGIPLRTWGADGI